MFDALVELMFRTICFPVGWPVVKIITLGKYPSKGSWFASTPESQWTTGTGAVVLAVAMMAALKQFVLV